MNPEEIKSVYFLGIGGIGMSALARYFHALGVKISGYDRSSTPLTTELSELGMDIHFEEDPFLIPADTDLVIYTPAIPASNRELQHIRKINIPLKKRAEVLGMISDPGWTVAVAGTHGKTTTATLIAHIFMTADKEMMAFLGGISRNYGTNFISSIASPLTGSPIYIVAEADEYDRSFLHLHPEVAVITSTDADHLDIYGDHNDMKKTYSEFAGNIRPGGALILKKGLHIEPTAGKEIRTYTYDTAGEADYCCVNLHVSYGTYHFDLRTPDGDIRDLTVGIPGRFNLENAVGAMAAALQSGVTEYHLREAVAGYRGVQRRFDLHCKRDDFVYIDDYAHHPEELKACINAVREVYPGKRITGVFQPHLFTRTRDFADGFARSLELLDEVILLEIYPARELPVEGVDSRMLLDKIKTENKKLCSKNGLIPELIRMRPEVLLTLGAGDIDQLVEPITRAFEKR